MRFKQFIIAFDQLVGTIFGGMADETISARAYREQWVRVEKVINFIFMDESHCMDSYHSELMRKHLPKGYRNGQSETR